MTLNNRKDTDKYDANGRPVPPAPKGLGQDEEPLTTKEWLTFIGVLILSSTAYIIAMAGLLFAVAVIYDRLR